MGFIANRLKNDYSQCPDMWQKIKLIVIKIMSLGYTFEGIFRQAVSAERRFMSRM
ncbi:hypothetical protein [Symbiopectobacterium sp. RP]|uniref:hypothetical protein n=1 Tax=Symbiopectobacterium sp. RP TaxID=3248553 RepID=UPI003D2DBF58